MLSENIRTLRNKKGLTQKELADLVHVTPQAVSRWESGDVEPSITTIQDLAKIFGVSMDELVGLSGSAEETASTEVSSAQLSEDDLDKIANKIAEQQKPVLGVCDQCKKPIFEADDLVQYRGFVRCADCENKKKEEDRQRAIEESKKCRKRGFVWGSLISISTLLIFVLCAVQSDMKTENIIAGAVGCALLFPFLSCLFLKNNFVGEMVIGIASWGFVRLPGLIFELSLDGIIWLLTVKLAFWLLGLLLATLTTILGVVLGMAISVFVYPFALRKSFIHPEETDTY